MLYLDANVFVYAVVNTGELGEKAGALLLKIQQGQEKAVTSALTADEVFWSIKKHDRAAAFEACQALLNFPNIEIMPATKELALSALQIIKEYRLDPRDALHAATAIAEKVDCIISTDAHFDRVKELKRRPL
jgi:predicted nucleic acid-binding protein